MGSFFGDIGSLFNLVISRPLGWILYWCYYITRNYGLAIILFTGITRVLLFPLSIKQQKSTSEMMRLQPKLTALQKKHAKDKAKLQEEQMKLYQEEGYNPLGGCLPLIIQLPILYGLYNVIYKPFTYILGATKAQMTEIVTKLQGQIVQVAGSVFAKNHSVNTIMGNSRSEIYIAGALKLPGSMEKIAGILNNTLTLNFSFLGLDLTKTPSLTNVYILIPIVCYLTSLLSSWLAMKMNQVVPGGAGTPGANPAGMNKSMIIIMPFISAFFSLSVPAGVGFYWICTNLFMIAQVFILNRFWNPKELAKKSELLAEKKRELKRQKMAEGATDEQPSYTPAAEETPKSINPQPKKVYEPGNGKKSKKQLMEENRRRLSAAREHENNKHK